MVTYGQDWANTHFINIDVLDSTHDLVPLLDSILIVFKMNGISINSGGFYGAEIYENTYYYKIKGNEKEVQLSITIKKKWRN